MWGNIKEKHRPNFHSCATVIWHQQAPDLSPPLCNVTSQSGSCAGVYGRPECVSSTWVAHVTFNDSGEGLLSITSLENRNGTLKGKWSHSSVFFFFWVSNNLKWKLFLSHAGKFYKEPKICDFLEGFCQDFRSNLRLKTDSDQLVKIA